MADRAENSQWQEYSLDVDASKMKGHNAWLEALEELKSEKPGAAEGEKKSAESAKAGKPEKPAGEAMDAVFCEVLEKVRGASDALNDFLKDHPYLFAPNVSAMWEDHLRETLVLLGRERERRCGPKDEG